MMLNSCGGNFLLGWWFSSCLEQVIAGSSLHDLLWFLGYALGSFLFHEHGLFDERLHIWGQFAYSIG